MEFTVPYKKIPLTATGAITIHPHRLNISFGRWAMPVMSTKLLDPDPLNRKRALQSLCDYVFDSRRVASKEFTSVVTQLKSLPDDEDKDVRLKLAECFCAIAASAAGRQTFEKHSFYGSLLKLVDDEAEDVRYAAFTAVHRVSLSPIGSESLVDANAIEVLLRRIPQESDSNLDPLLQALHMCCLVEPEKALEAGLQTLIPLLKKLTPKVRHLTGTVIKDLTIEASGRKQALELSAISPLLELCQDEDDLVKAKALAALMMITNAIPGKREAFKGGVIEIVLPLINSESVEVRLNAIKVLTIVGEAPEARAQLLKRYRMLFIPLHDDYDEVQYAATKLIKVVSFKP